MARGPVQVFSGGAIASGASTGTYIDMGDKSFNRMAVQFPAMSTAAVCAVWGSTEAAGTYKPVYQIVPSTATVAYQAVALATATSGGWASFEAVPFRYIKFVASDVVSGGVAGGFTIVVKD